MRFLESLLPGLRDLRTPLASGALWLLFLWMILAPVVPAKADATGFVRQLYVALGVVGTGYAVAVFVLIAYVLGLLAVTFADFVRTEVVRAWILAATGLRLLQWQRRARAKRASVQRALERAKTEIDRVSDPKDKESRLQAINAVTAELTKIRNNTRLFGLWISHTQQMRNLVGAPIPSSTYRVSRTAKMMVERAWEKGVDEELHRRGIDVRFADIAGESYSWDLDLLEHDLGHDPLDALRALDADLYQAFDRERAEREFRIGVMPAAAAIALFLSHSVNLWFYIGTGLAVLSFVQAARRQSQEKARVLNQIDLKGLPLPTMIAAERGGRNAVRHHAAKSGAPKPLVPQTF